MFKKKIIGDMILNIIAASVPIGVIQLVIYPILAKNIGGNSYGLLITIYSLWIMISNSLGLVLNNVRLLHNGKYEEEKLEGDFIIKLRSFLVVNAFAIGIATFLYYDSFSFWNILVSVITSCLVLLKTYLEVGFRIKLDYKKIVINNIIQSIGFIVGCYIAIKINIVEIVFFCGYLASVVYCIKNTELLKESAAKTKYYKKISKDSYSLVFATVIGNLMGYADKLILYPLMGGYTVSIYYTATVIGKIFGLLTGPVNSVILSYVAKWETKKTKAFTKMLFVGIIVSCLCYFVTLIVSKPIIGFLFPQWVDDVMKYVPITTIGVSLSMLISVIQPFVLKFCDMRWQIFINGISVITYFVASITLWKYFGLMGFCVGTVIGIGVKLITMLIIYKYNSVKAI